jgi:hypothetical protein
MSRRPWYFFALAFLAFGLPLAKCGSGSPFSGFDAALGRSIDWSAPGIRITPVSGYLPDPWVTATLVVVVVGLVAGFFAGEHPRRIANWAAPLGVLTLCGGLLATISTGEPVFPLIGYPVMLGLLVGGLWSMIRSRQEVGSTTGSGRSRIWALVAGLVLVSIASVAFSLRQVIAEEDGLIDNWEAVLWLIGQVGTLVVVVAVISVVVSSLGTSFADGTARPLAPGVWLLAVGPLATVGVVLVVRYALTRVVSATSEEAGQLFLPGRIVVVELLAYLAMALVVWLFIHAFSTRPAVGSPDAGTYLRWMILSLPAAMIAIAIAYTQWTDFRAITAGVVAWLGLSAVSARVHPIGFGGSISSILAHSLAVLSSVFLVVTGVTSGYQALGWVAAGALIFVLVLAVAALEGRRTSRVEQPGSPATAGGL